MGIARAWEAKLVRLDLPGTRRAALRTAIVLGAPFGLPMRRWMLELGAAVIRTETELVLKSRWVAPERLLDAGFRFEHPEFEPALRSILDRPRR